jgi:hypothetical protein
VLIITVIGVALALMLFARRPAAGTGFYVSRLSRE